MAINCSKHGPVDHTGVLGTGGQDLEVCEGAVVVNTGEKHLHLMDDKGNVICLEGGLVSGAIADTRQLLHKCTGGQCGGCFTKHTRVPAFDGAGAASVRRAAEDSAF